MRHTTDIQVRFRDLDPMQHVNNALYVTYLEQARADFYEEVVGVALGDIETVLVQLEVSFEQEIADTDSVTIVLTVGDLGETSIPMDYEIRDGDDRFATARTVQVFVDEGGDGARPIPDRYRERLTA